MTPLLIAHRGGAGLWPENTLRAFVESARAGYGAAELDVQLTRDGKLVAFHDFVPSTRNVRNMTDEVLSARGAVCDWDYTELRTLDVGAPGGPTDRIPLLSEVIDAVRTIDTRFHLFIELKSDTAQPRRSAAPEALAEAVIALIREKDFASNATLVGFDWAALRHAKKIAPEIPRWFTTQKPDHGEREGLVRATAFIAAIEAGGGSGWLAQDEDVTPEAVAEAHRAGLKCGVWTVNEPARMRALVAMGVDAICTDFSDRLRAL